MNKAFWYQTILQSYSHQDSMVLAQKYKYRPMEQDWKPRDKPMHLWAPLKNEAKIYNGETTASLVNGAEKTGQLYVKEHLLIPYTK